MYVVCSKTGVALGPVPSEQEAIDWAKNNLPSHSWWVSKLIPLKPH